MQSNRYGGKRVYRGRKSSAGSDSTIFLKAVGRVAFFPLLFVYLELVLHIAMTTRKSLSLRYCATFPLSC